METIEKIQVAVNGLDQTIKVQVSILEDIKNLLVELKRVNEQTLEKLK